MERKQLSDFTDAELAAMVRNSIYTKNTSFGDSPRDARFLLVMAVPYGNDEQCETLPEALDAFHRLLSDDDWNERDIQIYDHAASQHFFSASMEEVEADAA